MAQEPTSLPTGTNVNGYKIESVLGEGGMATVYRAMQVSLNRPVALKVLHESYSQREDFLIRFEQEAEALAQLQHPNIVAIIDRGHFEGRFYFVMEFVEGSDLDNLLADFEFDTKQIVQVINEVGKGMGYVHTQGIVHRDMKPANILIGTSGVIKVSDFGIAQIARGTHAGQPITGEGQAMGTGVYMAPEQMADAKNVDHRADIYALTATFYKLITRRLPMGSYKMPSELRKDIPKAVDELIRKGLDPDPNARPQSVRDFSKEMILALQGRKGGPGDSRAMRESKVASSDAMGRLRAAAASASKKKRRKKKKGLAAIQLRPPVRNALIGGGIALLVVGIAGASIHSRFGPSSVPRAQEEQQMAQLRDILGERRGRIQFDGADTAAATTANDSTTPDTGSAPPADQINFGEVPTSTPPPVDTPAIASSTTPTPEAPRATPSISRPTNSTAARRTGTGEPPPARLLALDGMTSIQSGLTTIGDDSDPFATPSYRDRVSRYFIDRTEVSNADYALFVASTGARPPDYWGGETPAAAIAQQPVHSVSHEEATNFARWVNKRLPTEAEWERAATNQRGSQSEPTRYPWGNDYGPFANIDTASLEPVGAPTNDSTSDRDPLLRMAGNVAEWTGSHFAPYEGGNTTRSRSASFYVIRGGSAHRFAEPALGDEEAARLTRRAYADPRARLRGVGFRCVRDISLAGGGGF